MKTIVLTLLFILMPMEAYAQVVSLGQVVYPVVAIASGTTASAYVQSNGLELVGCQIPAAFTGVSLSFIQAPASNATYYPVYNSSGVVSYTVAPGRYLSINPSDFAGVQFFKIVSGSSEGAARSLICSMKGM